MRNFISKIIVFILFPYLQANLASAQELLFEQYTIKDGLPSNWVTTIYQDSHGYLWVGGDGGLAVYDGVKFKRYGSKDGLEFPHVWSIIESKKSPDTFYIGTHGGGLTTLHDGKFTSRKLGPTMSQNVVGHLMEDRDGKLWIGTNDGLFTFENDSTAPFHIPTQADQSVAFIKQTKDSLIWISYDRQIYRYRPQKDRLESLKPMFPDSVAYICFLEDDDGTIWIGSDAGDIYQVKDDRVLASKKLGKGFPREILDDNEGNLWITTLNGPVLLNKASFPQGDIMEFSTFDGTLHEDVSPGLVDRENNLWFGTPRSGLFKLSDKDLIVFPFENISAFRMNGVMVDENDHLLTANANGIWEIWNNDDGAWKTHLHNRSELHIDDEVLGISQGSDGRTWVGDLVGNIYGYSRKALKQSPSQFIFETRLRPGADLHDGGRFGGFMIDHHNQLWYCRTAANGVSQYDLNEMKRVHVYSTEDGIPFGTITTQILDRDGNMWFGEFNGGVAVFKPAGNRYVHHRTYTVENGLGGNQIRSMIQRQNGEIWMGHRYDGITIFNEGKFTNISAKDGLINNAVWSLAEDQHGRVWFGTSMGIQYTSLDDDRVFVTDKRLIRTTTRVLGEIPNRSMMYMMNSEDLTLYRTRNNDLKRIAIPVEIKALRVSGQEADLSSVPSFQYDEDLFEIEFVGISLKDEDLLRFQYSLSSDNNEWQGTTDQRVLQFTSLRPGDYHFQVRAITTDGIESPSPAELRFSVLPPIWQRWWFVSLTVIAFGAFLYALHQVQLQRALAVERIRSRIATDLHDDIGAGLTHIGLLSEVALRKTGNSSESKESNGAAVRELSGSMERVGTIARELSSAMSDVVWSINPQHDSVEALQHRLTAFAHQICEARSIDLKINVSDEIAKTKLDPEVRRNLLLIAKEALHNVSKYSNSPKVSLKITTDGDDLMVVVEDLGIGFDVSASKLGNGINNMKTRAEKLGGRCEISSELGRGTKVIAKVKLNKEK